MCALNANTRVTNHHLVSDLSSLTLEDIDSLSETERDTLGPLPPPWPGAQYAANPYGPSYLPPPVPPTAPPLGGFPGPTSYASSGNYAPPNYAAVTGPPYGFANDTASYVSMPNANDSVHSSGEG